jgi:hypothetical protein
MTSKNKVNVKTDDKVLTPVVEDTIIFGVNVSSLPKEVQDAIREAAESAAKKAVEKNVKEETSALASNLRKRELVTRMVANLTPEDLELVKGKSLRIWFDDDSKAQAYPVISANGKGSKASAGNGSRTVKVRQDDKAAWTEYANSTKACNALGFPINGDNAYRVLVDRLGESNVIRVA